MWLSKEPEFTSQTCLWISTRCTSTYILKYILLEFPHLKKDIIKPRFWFYATGMKSTSYIHTTYFIKAAELINWSNCVYFLPVCMYVTRYLPYFLFSPSFLFASFGLDINGIYCKPTTVRTSNPQTTVV